MKFNDDTKQVKEFSDANWLGFGVHEVTIGLIELGETDAGKEYIEVTVLGPNDEEDTARVWFTSEKAANYSFNVLRAIYVHNAPEEAKDAARDTFDALSGTEELVKLFNEKLVGTGKCWFTKYYDPERTYTSKTGEVRRSINKNIYGYKPNLRPELMPKQDEAHDVTDEDLGNVGKTFPGAKKDDSAAGGIPKNW